MPPLPVNLDVGQTVGDYEILALLGQGGMGKVFKVRNLISDRIEAMKSLLPRLTRTPRLAERFSARSSWWPSLEHPNIASFAPLSGRQPDV